MSTRSAVGTIDEQGNFQGRYVHYDGSPSTRGRVLSEAIALYDGSLEHLLAELESHSNWLSISPERTADGVSLGRSDDDGSDGWERNGLVGSHGDVEEWGFFFTSRDSATAELVIVEGTGPWENPTPVEVGRVKVTELHKMSEKDWYKIECGENLERCSHYAWVHFEVPEESSRLGTAKWLGTQPLAATDATSATYKGQHYRFVGSGFSGDYRARFGNDGFQGRSSLWYEVGEDANGTRRDIPTHLIKSGKTISTTELHYPPISTDYAEIVQAEVIEAVVIPELQA